MKVKPSLTFLFQLLLLVSADLLYQKKRILQDQPLIQEVTSEESIPGDFVCNGEMMLSYGLLGNVKPSTEPHKYCPSIRNNCCTPQDSDTTMYFWQNDSRNRVEKYYEVFLYMVKYIMGYSAEGNLISKDFMTSSNTRCSNAAKDLAEMNLNPKLASVIYSTMAEAVVALGDLRKGFFCIICDARTQKALKDYWSVTNLFYNDRVYFSSEFCRKLVERTIKASYFLVTYVKRFSENLQTLMSCKAGSTTSMTYEISFLRKTQIKNCFFFKDKFFFFYCENYCEGFHLTKPSLLLDREIGELKKFFMFIKDNKDKVFYNPSNNVLINGFYEEDFVVQNIEKVEKTLMFLPAASKSTVNLAEFQTDIVYSGGMDPWLSVDMSEYQMVVSGDRLIAWGVSLALMICLLFR